MDLYLLSSAAIFTAAFDRRDKILDPSHNLIVTALWNFLFLIYRK